MALMLSVGRSTHLWDWSLMRLINSETTVTLFRSRPSGENTLNGQSLKYQRLSKSGGQTNTPLSSSTIHLAASSCCWLGFPIPNFSQTFVNMVCTRSSTFFTCTHASFSSGFFWAEFWLVESNDVTEIDRWLISADDIFRRREMGGGGGGGIFTLICPCIFLHAWRQKWVDQPSVLS